VEGMGRVPGDGLGDRHRPLSVEEHQAPTGWSAQEAGVRQILDDKIKAAVDHDPALLASTHLDECVYSRVHAGGIAYGRESVSEWAAIYAARRERGDDGRTARWRILHIGASGRLAFAKLEVVSGGTRFVDHLLLLRVADGWRIAAAVWGDPTGGTGAT